MDTYRAQMRLHKFRSPQLQVIGNGATVRLFALFNCGIVHVYAEVLEKNTLEEYLLPKCRTLCPILFLLKLLYRRGFDLYNPLPPLAFFLMAFSLVIILSPRPSPPRVEKTDEQRDLI